MRVSIGCDHGGLLLKGGIVAVLESLGHQIEDIGTFTNDSVDYPEFAKSVCAKVQDGSCERGILVCGTGIGMSMVANRFDGIRAALCHELYTARMSREHNNANVLCLGARVIGPGLADEIVRIWMTTDFAGGRHLKRIEMF